MFDVSRELKRLIIGARLGAEYAVSHELQEYFGDGEIEERMKDELSHRIANTLQVSKYIKGAKRGLGMDLYRAELYVFSEKELEELLSQAVKTVVLKE